MGKDNNTVVILCATFFQNGGGGVDLHMLASYARSISVVAGVFFYDDLTTQNQELLELVADFKINKVILAGDRPGLCQPMIRAILRRSGASKAELILLSFDEYGLNSKTDPSIARAYLLCTINGKSFSGSGLREQLKVREETLIIGAGIAGIQASLEIAAAGYKVYLLERSGTLGGHMAKFDKTFPTLDCAACILTPKMVEVGQNPNIEILTCSDLLKLSGQPGDFTATLSVKTRRVDSSKCTGCGVCAEKCPTKVLNEFDEGTSYRKAIYIPFPQAVPNKYLVDSENCRFLTEGKCRVCEKVCPASCINLEEKDSVRDIKVGNIIVASGFRTFDAESVSAFGYRKFQNVLTSLEFERIVNASGPTGGNIVFPRIDKHRNRIFDPFGNEPRSVAIIHCAGSRDRNHNTWCSRVCCMYSLKLAHLAKEKLPKASVFEYYIDMRAGGKGYEEFYNRIRQEEDIHVIRGKTASVTEQGDKLHLRSEDIHGGRLIEQDIDMVILSVGLQPDKDAVKLAQILDISHDYQGWFSERGSIGFPVQSSRQGIYIAGACQGPKDIPDSVAQASAAAAEVLQSITRGSVSSDFSLAHLKTLESEIVQ